MRPTLDSIEQELMRSTIKRGLKALAEGVTTTEETIKSWITSTADWYVTLYKSEMNVSHSLWPENYPPSHRSGLHW